MKQNTNDRTLRVLPTEEGRLDRYLAGHFPARSRTALQRLINSRAILVDGHPVSPHHRLHAGQSITIIWPKKTAPKLSDAPAECPFPILYEDDEMFVVDKPAGIVVHPAVGHHDGDTLIEKVRSKIPAGDWPDPVRPGLVHRLDRDTSGVMVLAKTPEAHARLARQFEKRQVKKTYLALVRGSVVPNEGTIESNLARHPGMRQRFAVSAKGRWASTRFRVVERFGERATLVELHPLTGRTHQIRVHLASFGHSILGDHVYGVADKTMPYVTRQMLHAWRLEITPPDKTSATRFESPLPFDFQQAVKLIRTGSLISK